MTMKDYIFAATFIGGPFIGGMLSGYITKGNMQWYKKLKKPWFTPPPCVFGPVWTCLYTSMGYASYLVYKNAPSGEATLPLAVYGAHLMLNFSWTPLFFGAHKLKASQIVGFGILAGALSSTYLFWTVDQLAGCLMLPYVGWSMFATVLSTTIVNMNLSASE